MTTEVVVVEEEEEEEEDVLVVAMVMVVVVALAAAAAVVAHTHSLKHSPPNTCSRSQYMQQIPIHAADPFAVIQGSLRKALLACGALGLFGISFTQPFTAQYMQQTHSYSQFCTATVE